MIKESAFLKHIVKEAIKISNKDFSVKSKGEANDLVTNLDLEIEQYLIDEIKKEYPSFDIVSEEFNTNMEVTKNCFIIDPIDGTINFANNIPLWGIQIACIKDGKTVASVISLPKINEFYYADETGAYLNDDPIRIKEVPIKNAIFVVDGKDTLSYMEKVNNYTVNKRVFGSACVSMAFVASGKIHGAVFLGDTPWDYEPGLYICKMAGAYVYSEKCFHVAAMNSEFFSILKKMYNE